MYRKTSVLAPPSPSKALPVLFERHHGRVRAALRRRGVPDADLDDAAQEVFLIAARRLGDFPPDLERAFLLGVAARVASTRRRTLRRRREVVSEDIHDSLVDTRNPETLIELKRTRAAFDRVVEAMTGRMRAVIVLTEIEERPLSEVASLLCIPLGTASSRLRAARGRIEAAVRRIALSEYRPA